MEAGQLDAFSGTQGNLGVYVAAQRDVSIHKTSSILATEADDSQDQTSSCNPRMLSTYWIGTSLGIRCLLTDTDIVVITSTIAHS